MSSALRRTDDAWLCVQHDQEQASRIDRRAETRQLQTESADELVRLARDGQYDLVIVPMLSESPLRVGALSRPWTDALLQHVHCPVFLAARRLIPQGVEDDV